MMDEKESVKELGSVKLLRVTRKERLKPLKKMERGLGVSTIGGSSPAYIDGIPEFRRAKVALGPARLLGGPPRSRSRTRRKKS